MSGRKQKYQGKHQKRNQKRPQSSPYRLTRSTLSELSSFLLSAPDDLTRGLALAKLATGRNMRSLVDASLDFEILSTGVGKLSNSWRYGEASSPIFDEASKLVTKNDNYILLPPCVAKPIAQARSQSIPIDILESKVARLLAGKRGPSGQLITPNALQRVIDFEFTTVNMTRFERDFIADRKMNDNMQNFYAAFSAKTLHKRHTDFIALFLPEDEIEAYKQAPIPDDTLFGSKKALSSHGVEYVFSQLQSALRNALIKEDRIAAHNIYTAYVVNLLQFATMHRPAPDVFRTIAAFLDDFNQMEIVDKSDSSARLVPVCQRARQVILHYIHYLKCYQERFRFTNTNNYQAIDDMLSGRSNLFRIQTASTFLPNFDHLPGYLSDAVFRSINWHRHTMASLLIQSDVDRDVLAAFMGHRQALDSPTKSSSTFRYQQLLDISERVDHIMEALALPKNSLMST